MLGFYTHHTHSRLFYDPSFSEASPHPSSPTSSSPTIRLHSLLRHSLRLPSLRPPTPFPPTPFPPPVLPPSPFPLCIDLQMKNKNPRSGLPNPRSRYFRSRPRGAILTAEADLSPDRSPPKNPPLTISETEVAQIPPPPPSPVPDLPHPDPQSPDLPHADPQSPKAHLSGDDLRPWVKLRQRRLPHYFYRRLPNWFYPDKSTHEPYTPWLYNKRRALPDGVVATGGPQPGASEMEPPEEEPPEEEEEEEEDRYPTWW